MRWYRGSDGSRRFYLDPEEIEATVENELRKAGLMPTSDRPVVDMEAFVERHLSASLDQHAILDPSILGLTEFLRGAPPKILINRDLTASALDADESPVGLRGRWRATVAHEGSHVVLHRFLFEFDTHQRDLFDSEPAIINHEQRIMRCLKREVRYSGGQDWREIQANRGMAALLMPKRLFSDCAQDELKKLGIDPDILREGTRQMDMLVRRMAGRFEVSCQAATIRLKTLGFVGVVGQEALKM